MTTEEIYNKYRGMYYDDYGIVCGYDEHTIIVQFKDGWSNPEYPNIKFGRGTMGFVKGSNITDESTRKLTIEELLNNTSEETFEMFSNLNTKSGRVVGYKEGSRILIVETAGIGWTLLKPEDKILLYTKKDAEFSYISPSLILEELYGNTQPTSNLDDMMGDIIEAPSTIEREFVTINPKEISWELDVRYISKEVMIPIQSKSKVKQKIKFPF